MKMFLLTMLVVFSTQSFAQVEEIPGTEPTPVVEQTPEATPVPEATAAPEATPEATPVVVEEPTATPVVGEEPQATPLPPEDVIVPPIYTDPDMSPTDNGGLLDSGADAVEKIDDAVHQEGATKVTIFFAIILILAQLLIQVTKAPIFGRVFSKVDDGMKLVIVSGLTILTTLVPMLQQGVGFFPSLLSGAVLSAVMVFLHQIYKKFFYKAKTV